MNTDRAILNAPMTERSGAWMSGFYFRKAILQYTARSSARETHDEHCLSHHYLFIATYRYPVKSMMGETLSDADIGGAGILGDRGWAVRDEKRDGIRGGKKILQLMTLAAQSGPAAPLITAPDGDSASASSEGIKEWISDKLGHPVTLWPLLPADQLDHCRRGAPDTENFEQELRAVFGRLPDEPLPDLARFEELLAFESPPGTYFDAFPMSIVSQQSLKTMNQLEGESNLTSDASDRTC